MNMKRQAGSFVTFLIAAFLLIAAAPVFCQENPTSGAIIKITIVDTEQRPIPGAICLLTSKTKVTRNVVTDENGTVVINGLAIGNYSLSIDKKGFEAFLKNNIDLVASGSIDIAATLIPAVVSATVNVDNPTETVNSVQSGSSLPAGIINRTTLAGLPLATKRVDEAIPLVPGVIRSPDGQISINGANEGQSAFHVNGLNVADPSSGNFRLNLPIDAVESVQVFRHPYSAEYGQLTGGLTNIETRRGGDKWHFEANDFLPDFRFINGRIVGVRDDTPHVNFNGPLLSDKLFVSQSIGYSISKTPVRGLIFPNNETISESQSYFTQIDFIASPVHSQTFTFGYFPERQSFVNLDFFRPKSVTPNYKQKDFVGTYRDNYALSDGLLQTSVSYKRFDAHIWGQGKGEQFLDPTGERGNYYATEDRKSSRLEFFEIYEFPTVKTPFGDHNFKSGFNFTNVASRLDYLWRPVNVIRHDGTLATRVTFESAQNLAIGNRTYTGFLQDRWIIRPNFSVDAGIRIEDQRIAKGRNFAPRVGFSYSPFAGDKTIIRGGVGLFYDKVPLNIRAFGQLPVRTVTRFSPDGLNVISQTRFENVLVDDPSLIPLDFRRSEPPTGLIPQNLSWNLQLDQIINSLISLRVNFSHSTTDGLYIVSPQTDFFGRRAIVLTPSGRTNYTAIEVTAKVTLPKSKQFFVSYVASKARGDLNDFNTYYGDFGFPIIRQNQSSNLSTDIPHRLLAWGSFSLPSKVTVSPIFEWRSGFPYSVVNETQSFVGIRNADGQRFPNFLSLDVEVSRNFQVTKKYAIQLSVKGFNLTNHFNPRNLRNNINDPSYGTFLNNYRRSFSGGFDIIF